MTTDETRDQSGSTPTDGQVNLNELQRLADASTPGPWSYHETLQADNHVTAGGGILTGTHVCGPTYERHNARFIAASRDAVPSLIQRVRELEAALAAAGVAPPAPTGSGLGPRDHGDRETHNRTDDPAGDEAPHEDAEQGAHDGTECGDDKDTAEAHEVQASNGLASPAPSADREKLIDLCDHPENCNHRYRLWNLLVDHANGSRRRGKGSPNEESRVDIVFDWMAQEGFTLTGPASVDEAKLAEALEVHEEVYLPMEGNTGCRCGWRRSADATDYRAHRARAVCEDLDRLRGERRG